jgi:hypothetical protein
MKQKLKFLLAYCRGISDSLETTILFDRRYIEDWDKEFETSEGKYVKFTKTFDDILIDGHTKEEEYEDSGVNLEVTLDNIEESED